MVRLRISLDQARHRTLTPLMPASRCLQAGRRRQCRSQTSAARRRAARDLECCLWLPWVVYAPCHGLMHQRPWHTRAYSLAVLSKLRRWSLLSSHGTE